MVFIDLNRFKLINDRLGHDAGDRALVEIGRRLREATRSGDLVARYAGDEFVLLIEGVASHEVAEQVRRHLEEVLRRPLQMPEAASLAAATASLVGDEQRLADLSRRVDAYRAACSAPRTAEAFARVWTDMLTRASVSV